MRRLPPGATKYDYRMADSMQKALENKFASDKTAGLDIVAARADLSAAMGKKRHKQKPAHTSPERENQFEGTDRLEEYQKFSEECPFAANFFARAALNGMPVDDIYVLAKHASLMSDTIAAELLPLVKAAAPPLPLTPATPVAPPEPKPPTPAPPPVGAATAPGAADPWAAFGVPESGAQPAAAAPVAAPVAAPAAAPVAGAAAPSSVPVSTYDMNKSDATPANTALTGSVPTGSVPPGSVPPGSVPPGSTPAAAPPGAAPTPPVAGKQAPPPAQLKGMAAAAGKAKELWGNLKGAVGRGAEKVAVGVMNSSVGQKALKMIGDIPGAKDAMMKANGGGGMMGMLSGLMAGLEALPAAQQMMLLAGLGTVLAGLMGGSGTAAVAGAGIGLLGAFGGQIPGFSQQMAKLPGGIGTQSISSLMSAAQPTAGNAPPAPG